MTTHLTDRDLKALQDHIDRTGSPDGFKPAARRRRRNDESVMQRALVRWFDANARSKFGLSPLLLFSIPNGFNGDARRGSVMKAEGQRKGCPDLMLAVPAFERTLDEAIANAGKAVSHALFLELKTPTGRLSPEQEAYHEALRAQGYRVAVCRSLDDCVKTITEYLT